MDGRRLLHSLKLSNLLSFQALDPALALGPLNVLIGPNASGKSNLIETLSILKAAPADLLAPIREGGGVQEWIWKGGPPGAHAGLEAVVEYPEGTMPLRYRLAFTVAASRLELTDEVIENERATIPAAPKPYFFYSYQSGHPAINTRQYPEQKPGVEGHRTERKLRREDVLPDQSILSQKKDAELYPELTYVGIQFSRIRLYREWNFGRYTPPRLPQKADLPNDFLLEDASNLGLVLNDLQNRPPTWQQILKRLAAFHDTINGITTRVEGGTVQVFFHETGLARPVPATRVSDGTLRFVSLLAILCHPDPPPLVCIEEPELGLHPDAVSIVAELLIDAAKRAQFIVTTHSEAFVSALSEVPEAVVVCERPSDGTTLRRLEPDQLSEWLERYKLGDLWRMGEIGGTRW